MNKSAMRFQNIEESIFTRMTRLAVEQKAFNLAQGFPDFSGPSYLIERLHYHLDTCTNQYTRSPGHLALCEALQNYSRQYLPRTYDAGQEITVVNGATEGVLCAVVGLVNPGQKILVFEPYYESYLTCAQIAGAELVGVPLLPPNNDQELEDGVWHIDWSRFENAIKNNVGLILLNHPHNPTGKVFAEEELIKIFDTAQKHNIPVAIDGVYEQLVYSCPRKNFMPFLAKYSDNIIFISAISKTLSFTGFKIGWILAPKAFTPALRRVHEGAVYCQPPHLQLAVADMLNNEAIFSAYVKEQRINFMHIRDEMRVALSNFGFRVPNAQGTYFLLAEKHKAPLKANLDIEMAEELLNKHKIATIPVSGFYVGPVILENWLRFAFCKRPETIAACKKALLVE